MRVLVNAAMAAAVLLGAAAPVGATDDPGHRFAPSLARTYVAEIQRQLAGRGYFAGVPSGLVTPETRAAIAAYQHDAGLVSDGIADMAVINMLNFGPAVHAGSGVAGSGHTDVTAPQVAPAPADSDHTVRELQETLKAQGLYSGPLDGNLNAQTLESIHAYQQRLATLAPPPATAPPPPAPLVPPVTPPAAKPAPPPPAPSPPATADESPPPLAAPRPEVTTKPLAPPAAEAPPPADDGKLLPILHRGPLLRATPA